MTGWSTPFTSLRPKASFGGGAVVHALHLTDETHEPVVISGTKLANRKKKSDTMLAGIASGEFPPEVDAVTCPRCPHFFICPPRQTGASARLILHEVTFPGSFSAGD